MKRLNRLHSILLSLSIGFISFGTIERVMDMRYRYYKRRFSLWEREENEINQRNTRYYTHQRMRGGI